MTFLEKSQYIPEEGDQLKLIDPKMSKSPGFGKVVTLTRDTSWRNQPFFTSWDYKVNSTGQGGTIDISINASAQSMEIELVSKHKVIDA